MCGPKIGKSSEIVHCWVCKWHHCTVAEVLIQHGMVPISPLNICKVLDNLYMLWMGIWRHRKAMSTTCVGQKLGSPLKFWFTAGLQLTPLCSGWGSNPTWNGYHIPPPNICKAVNNFHMLWMGIWVHHTKAMSTMCVGQYLGSLLKSFTAWSANDTIVQWLRL